MTAVALEATRIRIRGTTLLAGVVVVVAALVSWWASVPYVVGVWHDDGVYALLGRAIASGQGFHYTQLPGAPVATHYPPLYPLLLAAAWKLSPSFPDNISTFLALNAMLVGVAALGAFHFTRVQLAWRDDAAAVLVLAATLATPVLALSGAVLSECLFLALLWPALVISERAVDDRADAPSAVAAGAVVGILALVRTHAAALLIALVLVLLIRRRPRHAAVAVGAAVGVQLPWQLWTVLATPRVAPPLEGAYGSYLGWFVAGLREGGLSLLGATARLNVSELWLLTQDRVVPGNAEFGRIFAAALLLAFAAAGLRTMVRRAPVTVWFLVMYFAIVIVWPYTPWRFVWAVWPLVLTSAMAGAWWLWQQAPDRWTRALVAGVIALPAFGTVRTEAHAYASRAWSEPALRAGTQITPLVAWVGRNTSPSDIVLAEGEQVISLFTGRRAAPTAPFSAREYVQARTLAQSTAELREMMSVVPARFVLPLAPVQLDAARALAGSTPGLRAVVALPRSTVFEVVR